MSGEVKAVNVRWHMPTHKRDAHLRPLSLTKVATSATVGECLLEGQVRGDTTPAAVLLRITHQSTDRVLNLSGNLSQPLYNGPLVVYGGLVGRAVASTFTSAPQPAAAAAVEALFTYLWDHGLVRSKPREREAELRQVATGIPRASINAWFDHPYWAEAANLMASGEAPGLLWAAGAAPTEAAEFVQAFHRSASVDGLTRTAIRTYLGHLDRRGAEFIARLSRSGRSPEEAYRLIVSHPLLRDALFAGLLASTTQSRHEDDPRWEQVPEEWAVLAAFAGLGAEEALTAYADGTLDEEALRFMAALT